MTHRGSFQPLPSCDSVKTKVFGKLPQGLETEQKLWYGSLPEQRFSFSNCLTFMSVVALPH